MLDVTKSESNMRSYLSDGLIKKEPFKQIVYDTLMRNHKESLQLADELFSRRRSTLWTIVISYYSMFYIASAALYKRGYKIGDRGAHKIAADGLVVVLRNRLAKSLFEEYDSAREDAQTIAKMDADEIIESFDKERGKRSEIQYETTDAIKEGKAKTSLERAKRFSTAMQKMMEDA